MPPDDDDFLHSQMDSDLTRFCRDRKPRRLFLAALSMAATACWVLLAVPVHLGLSAGYELGYLLPYVACVWLVGLIDSAIRLLRNPRAPSSWTIIALSSLGPLDLLTRVLSRSIAWLLT